MQDWQSEKVALENATAEDEIRSLVDQDALHEEQDAELEDDERRMIRGVFDLDETLVREIMTPRVDVDAIDSKASLKTVKQTIVESGGSRIPFYSNNIDHIVGLLYAKDLLDDPRIETMQGLQDLYHHPTFIPETKNIGDLLAEFQQTNHQFAVVLDEYGGTAGVVTVEDILEEIVGEIRDEYDINEEDVEVEELSDGSLVSDARLSIDRLNEILDMDLPEDEDYDTLGGYISSQAGRIPQKGESVETDALAVEVLEADPRRVRKAKVRKIEPPDENHTDE